MPDTDPYTTSPTRFRIHAEDDGAWALDGIDDAGNYTESCWTFDTHAEAIAALPEFRAMYGGEGVWL